MTQRAWVVPHVVEFDPILREAFLTVESYFAQVSEAGGLSGIFWWEGNGNPNSLTLSSARGGDFFVDNITGDLYRLVADDYTRSGSGGEDESRAVDPGSMWWDDDAAPTSTALPYRVHDFWLDTTTLDLWTLR